MKVNHPDILKPAPREPDPWPSRILLGVNLAAWAVFVALTLPARRRSGRLFEQLGMKDLPAPTELFLLPPDTLYVFLSILPVVVLALLEFVPVAPGARLKANVVVLVAVFLLYGFFTLAMETPVRALQRALEK